jgi:drug/metabolite transporter (DMT)-like permease
MSEQKQSFHYSMAYMSFSASCLSASFLFMKLGMQGLPFLVFIFLRFVSPLLVLCVWLIGTGRLKQSLHTKVSFSSHLLRAFSVLAFQYSILFYLTQNSLLNATVLLNAGPLFIPLIEKVFLKHKIGKSTVISLIVSAIGMILILQPEAGILNSFMFIGLLAAFMQGCSQVLYSMYATTEAHGSSLFYLFFLCSVFSFFVLLGGIFGFHIPSLSASTSALASVFSNAKLGLFLFLMAVCNLGNQFFRGLAYASGGRAGNLAPFLYFSVLLSGLFDWLIFHHLPTIWTIIGSCLVILGGVLKIYLRRLFLKKQ